MPVPIFAIPSFGVRGRIDPMEGLYVQLAVFDGNPSHIGSDGEDDNLDGTDFRWGSDEGLFVGLEAGYEIGKDYKGTYKIGIGYHTADFVTLDNPLEEKSGNYAFYILGDQKVYSFGEVAILNAFLRVAIAPDDRNLVSSAFEFGVCAQGLFGRADDQIGLGIANVSLEPSDSETVIELTYKMQVFSWLTAQPDLQYIMNPGGDSAKLDDAIVLGLRCVVSF